MPGIRESLSHLSQLIDQDTDKLTPIGKVLVMLARGLYALWRDISQGQLTLRAMSLSFTTLLSLVPLLALSFSVLKGFGVHNSMEPMLLKYLAPLGDKGIELTDKIIDFVSNMNVGVLGSMGLALLLYTVVSLVQKIEEAFNFIWNVKESRGLSERFRDYLSAVLIGPFVMMVAFGLSASVRSSTFVQMLLDIESIGVLILILIKLIPFFMIIAGFTFIYSFMPNTKVHIKSALLGAVVAGILWQSAGWGFTSFVAGSTKYTAIYSSFAVLVLFLIWLHVSWLLVLIGANISYYYQHPEHLLLPRDKTNPSNDSKERLALQIMYLIADSHQGGRTPWSLKSLSDKLFVPQSFLCEILNALECQGLLAQTASEPTQYLPARAIDTITIKSVYDAINRFGDGFHTERECNETVNRCYELIDQAVDNALKGETLKDLVTKP